MIRLDGSILRLNAAQAGDYKGLHSPQVLLSLPALGVIYSTDFTVQIIDKPVECTVSGAAESHVYRLDDGVELITIIEAFTPSCDQGSDPSKESKIFYEMTAEIAGKADSEKVVIDQLSDKMFTLRITDPSLAGSVIKVL